MQITYIHIFRIILSAILTSWIGYERSTKSRSAGMRTHALVGISATLVMIVSENLFYQYSALGAMPDPARLGAQIISGVGFLGAGTIIQGKGSVKGLTTAASVWSVAIIGIAVGTGNYILSIYATLIIYSLLRFATIIEKKLVNPIYSRSIFIQTRNNNIELFREMAIQCDVYVEDLQYMGSDILDSNKIHFILLKISPKHKSLDKYHNLLQKINTFEDVIKVKVLGDFQNIEEF